MSVIWARFSTDDRPIPEPESRVSFAVPDAQMELEDGIILRIGSERTWRFDCIWTHRRLVVDEIWIWDDRDPDIVTHVCLDIREDAASREIAAALRRYYEFNPNGQKTLRWHAERAEEDASA